MTERYELHEFDVEARYGRIGEGIVVQALRSLPDWSDIEVRTSVLTEQKRFGIDRMARYRGNKATIEIKTDMKGYKTFKIALETHDDKDDGSRRDGWMRTTTAGYILPLLIDRRGVDEFDDGCELDRSAMLYLMSTQTIQARMPDWERRYGSQKAKNRGYFTSVVPVPVEVIRASGGFVAEYAVAYRNVGGSQQVTAFPRPTGGSPFTIIHPLADRPARIEFLPARADAARSVRESA